MENLSDAVTDEARFTFLATLSVMVQRRMLRALLALEGERATTYAAQPSALTSSGGATGERPAEWVRARGSVESQPEPLPVPREADRVATPPAPARKW